mmetsp:Transcript_29068/g.44651  ORF Transcript_29068/g.44651 Transcript_29068/m.44651 type:complete len:242 (-) Transcript_29068:193-918(-)
MHPFFSSTRFPSPPAKMTPEIVRKTSFCRVCDPSTEFFCVMAHSYEPNKSIMIPQRTSIWPNPRTIFSSSSSSSSKSWSLSSLITTCCALIGLSLSIVLHTSCKFFDLPDGTNNTYLSIGIWSNAHVYNGSLNDFGGTDKCYRNHHDIDTPLTVSRIAAVSATVLGGIFAIMLIYNVSLDWISMRRLSTWLGLVLICLQGLTLVLYDTEQCMTNDCEFGNGALCAITATLYWCLCVFGLWV